MEGLTMRMEERRRRSSGIRTSGITAFFQISLAIFCLWSLFTSVSGQTEVEDVLSLIELKRVLGYPLALNNWEGDPCLDNWTGIKCKELSRNDKFLGYTVTVLWLPDLGLEGPLPDRIMTMENLEWFAMKNNSLSGPLPPSLGSTPHLLYVDLSSNHFSGEISLKTVAPLESLILADNELTGPVPGCQLAELKTLKNLRLGRNQLNGTIPEQLGNLSCLETLCISDNLLTGSVPPSLAELPKLRKITLQNNLLSGAVSAKFLDIDAKFYGNEDLCQMDASGDCSPFPEIQGSDKLKETRVATSINGEINNVDLSANSKCVLGDTRICHCQDGQQGSETCDEKEAWAECSCETYIIPSGRGSQELPWWSIILIASGGMLTGLFYILICFCIYRQFKPHGGYKRNAVADAPSPGSQSPSRQYEGDYAPSAMKGGEAAVAERKPTAMALARSWGRSITMRFSQQDVAPEAYPTAEVVSVAVMPSWPSTPRSHMISRLSFDQIRLATNNFDTDNILGTDGIARVYKAVLPDRRIAVVKELEFLGSGRNSSEKFSEDMALFQHLEHRNLVRMIGYCAEEDSRLVVLEYIPNGSLDQHLHDIDMGPCLDWDVRMHILLGVAKGLDFLHDLDPPLVHKELRATNVLLDNSFDVKLSDYALTHLAGQPAAPPTLSATVNVEVAAGIAAPELAWAQEFTIEMDVYAFGVLILEVITGRRPLDTKRPANEQALVRWARPRLTERNRVEAMVDWRLDGVYSSPALYQAALLAWQCLQKEPESRPTMAQAVEVLEKLQSLPIDAMAMAAMGAQQQLQMPEPRLHEFLGVDMPEDSQGRGHGGVGGGGGGGGGIGMESPGQWSPAVQIAIPVEEDEEEEEPMAAQVAGSSLAGGAMAGADGGAPEWMFRRSQTMERGAAGERQYERTLSAPLSPREIDFPPRRSLRK